MGRILKRVPLDFDWPLNKVWEGYLNPYHSINCPECFDKEDRRSSGWTHKAAEYEKLYYCQYFHGHMIQHPYISGRLYNPMTKPYTFERWEYDFIISDEKLKEDVFGDNEIPAYNDIEEFFLRHPYLELNISQIIYPMTMELARREGFEPICPRCHGHGYIFESEEIERLNENWEPTEPPRGKGYQLWETTSEGSPQSPVFETLDELCEWCEKNAHTFATETATKEQWKKMLEDDFVYHQEGNAIFI